MLSPLLLNSLKAEARETDPSLEGADESFRERNGSRSLSREVVVEVEDEEGAWFRLRLAIFEEGGTGISGAGQVCLGFRGLRNNVGIGVLPFGSGVAGGGGGNG